MKLLIAIPSKGRADRINRLLNWLQFSKYDKAIFVEPQELKEYKEWAGDLPIIDIKDSNRGLGYAKTKIAEYAKKHSYDLIFKMDDDIDGFVGRGRKLEFEDSAKRFDEMVSRCITMLSANPDIAAVGFPYRWELYEVRTWVAMNMRLQTAYIVRTNDLYPDERISSFEDFHTYLMIRANNRFTIRYGALGISCAPVGKNEGGHQVAEIQRGKRALAEAELLRKVYPALQFKKVEGKTWELEPSMKGAFFGVKKL